MVMKHKNSLLIWLAVVVAICAAYFFVMYVWFPGNMEKRGQFGDMFGFLGALFSGLAFAGLIVTIRQQREDLKNQRDEIELQREDLKAQTEALKLQKEEIRQTNEELKLQRKEMEEQNKTIMLQRFETTFFNMLKNQMEIRNAIKYPDGLGVYEGKDAIERIYQTGFAKIQKLGYNVPFMKYYMSHFFRHLIQTLKIIDAADFLSCREKYYYSEILSSHMSIHELCSVFYYCLSDEGKENAKFLVEKYALFKPLNNGETFSKDELSLFSDGAFIQQI
jgi:hypothetical protein